MHPSECIVFIQIVAAATINFSLAWVRLLIEGGSYLRGAFGPIRDGVIHKNCSTENWFMNCTSNNGDTIVKEAPTLQ